MAAFLYWYITVNYTEKTEALECTQRAFRNTLCIFIPYKSTESIL